MDDRNLCKILEGLGLWVDHRAKVLICRHDTCKTALSVQGSCATTHLRVKHQVKIEQRRGLAKILQRLQLYCPNRDKVSPRPDGLERHPYLQVFDGYHCSSCGARDVSLDVLMRHYFKHNGKGEICPAAASGQFGLSDTDGLIEYVYLQTWRRSPGAAYWLARCNGSTRRQVLTKARVDNNGMNSALCEDSTLSYKYHWNDEEELIHWENCLEWWKDKCSLCIGRGVQGSPASHRLRECTHHDEKMLETGLGKYLFCRKLLPSTGCANCHVPVQMCNSWARDDAGDWVVADSSFKQCQHRSDLLSEVILGLHSCGKSIFQDGIMDHAMNSSPLIDWDEKSLASFLTESLTVEDVEASQMLRAVGCLTTLVWDTYGKDAALWAKPGVGHPSTYGAREQGSPPVENRYMQAIRRASASDTGTEWVGERHDIPPLHGNNRAHCEKWLGSIAFLEREGHFKTEKWVVIQRHWISFLSATSTLPNEELCPSYQGLRGLAQKNKFDADRAMRKMTQATIWQAFDGLEALVERWPRAVRVVMNTVDSGHKEQAFETMAAIWDLAKRRRYQAVWTSFIGFLVYSCEQGTLKDIGLQLRKAQLEDIQRIRDAVKRLRPGTHRRSRGLEQVSSAIQTLLLNGLQQQGATVRNNPLLWWVAILVKSAVLSSVSGEADFISCGRFVMNPMPMDLNLEGRVEAIVHYSKVLMLDTAFHTWRGRSALVLAVQRDLNSADNQWLNDKHGKRPLDTGCSPAPCHAWDEITRWIQDKTDKLCGGSEGTAMFWVCKLEGGMDTPVKTVFTWPREDFGAVPYP